MLQSEMEKFNTAFEQVPSKPFAAPASMLESRESRITPAPLMESRLNIKKQNDKKKADKQDSSKTLNEAAVKVSDLYGTYIMEGVLENAKRLHPENAAQIEAFEYALCEAATKAKEFLS